jgi:hypothetical protein
MWCMRNSSIENPAGVCQRSRISMPSAARTLAKWMLRPDGES